MSERICSIEGCERGGKLRRGWCGMHYDRWYRHGDPEFTTRIVGTGNPAERFWAHVDKSGPCWEWIGGTARGGYGVFGVDGRTVPAHRFSFELANGTIPDGLWVDHICHIPPCVNPDHLRLATPSQNNQHRRRSPGTASGFKGVVWHSVGKSWMAQIQHQRKTYYLGLYATAEEAARIYDREARRRFGAFAVTNFPA